MDSAGAIDFDFRRARKRVCTVEEARERLLTGAPSCPPESAYPRAMYGVALEIGSCRMNHPTGERERAEFLSPDACRWWHKVVLRI